MIDGRDAAICEVRGGDAAVNNAEPLAHFQAFDLLTVDGVQSDSSVFGGEILLAGAEEVGKSVSGNPVPEVHVFVEIGDASVGVDIAAIGDKGADFFSDSGSHHLDAGEE